MGTRVLVHGLGGLPSSWARVVDAGSDEIKHHMLCLPGHGAVAPGKENATFAGIADSLWAQLTLSPEERVHLVGYSLGARMAMAMSARRPDRVGRLSLIAGHPGLRDEGERAQRRQWDAKWARVLQDEGTAAFVREWEQLPLFQSQTRLGSAVRAEHRSRRLSHDPIGLAWAFSRLGLGCMPSFWDDVGGMQQPVDYLVGALDTRYLAIGRELVEGCARGKLFIAPECGHDLILEAPEWVAERLGEDPDQTRKAEVDAQ